MIPGVTILSLFLVASLVFLREMIDQRVRSMGREQGRKSARSLKTTYAARVVLLLDLNRALHAVLVLAQAQAVAPAHALQHAPAERLAATAGLRVMEGRSAPSRGRGRGKVLRGQLHGCFV